MKNNSFIFGHINVLYTFVFLFVVVSVSFCAVLFLFSVIDAVTSFFASLDFSAGNITTIEKIIITTNAMG